MENRFLHSAWLVVWLAAIAGGGAAENAPGAATPGANGGGVPQAASSPYVSVVNTWPIRLIMDVTVPANTQALVHVPGENAQVLPPAGTAPVPGTRTAAGDTLFAVPGGKYAFESRL